MLELYCEILRFGHQLIPHVVYFLYLSSDGRNKHYYFLAYSVSVAI